MTWAIDPSRNDVASTGLPVDDTGGGAMSDEPGRDLRLGVIVCLVFFVGFLGWAAFAPMDQAAYAVGQVSVSGRRQSVEHQDGGIVSALNVREGDVVQKGQVVVALADGDALAEERSLAVRVIGLKAQRSRLIAEQARRPIVWPEEFKTYTGADRIEADNAIALQLSQFKARGGTLTAQGGVLGQRTAQLRQQILGLRGQLAAVSKQSGLLEEELVGLRELSAKGFVSANQVRAYERQLSQLDGSKASLTAQIAAYNNQIAEIGLQQGQVYGTQLESVAAELREIEGQLSEATPRWSAAQARLSRTKIRAPVAGKVVGLSVFTVGGVIAPGAKLMEVVPKAAPLVLDTRLSPNDADDLQVGQKTEVQFGGIHERSLPRLTGVVSRISADSFSDERGAFFTAEITVPLSELRHLRAAKGKNFELIPGMPVSVVIPLKKRTALQYLLEPLTSSMWLSFREH